MNVVKRGMGRAFRMASSRTLEGVNRVGIPGNVKS